MLMIKIVINNHSFLSLKKIVINYDFNLKKKFNINYGFYDQDLTWNKIV